MEAAPSHALAGQRAAIGLCAGFVLAALAAMGGAIGVALAAAIGAAIAMPRPQLWRRLAVREPALLAFAAFLAWITLTQLWSPATARQISVLWLEVALFSALLLAAAFLPEARRVWPRRILVVSMLVLTAVMAVEGVTQGAITAMVEGLEPGDPTILTNLGRGASAQIIMTGPAAAVAWGLGGRWRLAAGALAVGALIPALALDTFANLVAVPLAAGLMALGWRWPRATLLCLGGALVAWVMVFPLLLILLQPVADSLRHEIPYSWEWRLVAWRYSVELIMEHPIAGWGMDAARTFQETIEIRGLVLPRMPLHPHSAALQIWVETGVAGAVLLCEAVGLTALRAASAPRLDRVQAAGAAWAIGAVSAGVAVSYGVWQEWLCASAVVAAAICLLAGRGPGQAAGARAPL